MNLGNIKIGKRLIGSFSVFLLIIIILAAYFFVNMGGVDKKTDDIVNYNFEKTVTASQILSDIQIMNRELTKVVYAEDKAPMKIIGERRKIYSANLEKLEKMEKDPEGKKLIEAMKNRIGEGREGNQKIAKLVEEGNFKDAQKVFATVTAPVTDKIVDAVNDLVKFQEKRVHEKHEEIRSSNQLAKIVLAIAVLVSLVICIAITVVITRSITIPIDRSSKHLDLMTKGNFSIPVSPAATERKDEMGTIARSLDGLNTSMRNVLTEVKSSATSVASASHQLSASAEQLNKGANDQVARTTQAATASEEMSQASLDIAKNTARISEFAKGVVDVAIDGKDVVGKAVDEVREIQVTVEKSASFVTELGEKSEMIGDIVNVINEIADQTNLLALNAAIEAARAGESGRGFAVVADEVKKLAERTGGSTSEIGAMISDIKTGVSNAVEAMEEATKKVELGVKLSGQAGQALDNIVSSATELQTNVQQIAAAVEEMNATTDEISKDVENVSQVAKESSNASGQITQAAQELADLAVNLERSVNEFQV